MVFLPCPMNTSPCHVTWSLSRMSRILWTISPKTIWIKTTEFSPGLKLFSMNLFLVILILKHFLAKKKVLKNLFLLPIHTICKATENTVCTNTELKNNVCMFL